MGRHRIGREAEHIGERREERRGSRQGLPHRTAHLVRGRVRVRVRAKARVRVRVRVRARARVRAWARVRVRATRYTMQVPPQSPQSGGTAPNSTAGSPLDLLGRAVSRAFRGGM